MAICAKIASGITLDCNATSTTAGVDSEEIHIWNWTDINRDGSTFDSTNPIQLESISVNATTNGYTFQGVNNSVRPTYTNVQDGYLPNKHTHTIEFRIFNYTDANKKIINDMIGSKLVVAYKTKSGIIDILGWSVGLTTVNNKNFYENDGANVITLATPEGEFENSIPYSYVGSTSPQSNLDTLWAEILAL